MYLLYISHLSLCKHKPKTLLLTITIQKPSISLAILCSKSFSSVKPQTRFLHGDRRIADRPISRASREAGQCTSIWCRAWPFAPWFASDTGSMAGALIPWKRRSWLPLIWEEMGGFGGWVAKKCFLWSWFWAWMRIYMGKRRRFMKKEHVVSDECWGRDKAEVIALSGWQPLHEED